MGLSETSKSEWSTSVCPPAADPDQGKGLVRFVPKGDMRDDKFRVSLVVAYSLAQPSFDDFA